MKKFNEFSIKKKKKKKNLHAYLSIIKTKVAINFLKKKKKMGGGGGQIGLALKGLILKQRVGRVCPSKGFENLWGSSIFEYFTIQILTWHYWFHSLWGSIW